VVTLERTGKRIGDMSCCWSDPLARPQANLRYAEFITQQLRALPPRVWPGHLHRARRARLPQGQPVLYMSEEDLTTIRDRLRKEVARRKNPLMVDLAGRRRPVDALKKRLTSKDPLESRFPDGVFSNADGTYVWIAALPPAGCSASRRREPAPRRRRPAQDQRSPPLPPADVAYVAGRSPP
jgi:hypothetical protein